MYWFTGLLGLALGIAPYALGYSDTNAALWSAIVLGVAALAASAYKAFAGSTSNWEYWVIGIAGILAVAAPFVLGFSAMAMAMWTFIVLGALMILAAAYELFFHHPQQQSHAGSRA